MRCMREHPNRQTQTRDEIFRHISEGMTVTEAEAAMGATPAVMN